LKRNLFSCLVAIGLAVFLTSTAQVTAANGDDKAGTSNLNLKIGEPFLRARARIVKSGWKPNPVHSKDHYEYSGAEKRLVERGFLEVDTCSVDAGANCILYYMQGSRCLRIDTVGEQVRQMMVTRWADECPAGEPP
jgi:hypothetical protein